MQCQTETGYTYGDTYQPFNMYAWSLKDQWQIQYSLSHIKDKFVMVGTKTVRNYAQARVCWTRSTVFAAINVWRCSKQSFRLTCILVNRVCLQSNFVGSLVGFPCFGGEIIVFHPLGRWRGFQHSSLLQWVVRSNCPWKPKRSQNEM